MIAGHLREKRGYYHIVLSLRVDGKPKPKWISTGLKVQRGNKKKAEEMLQNARQEYSNKQELPTAINVLSGDMLFSDFMKFWLSTVKSTLKETTYNSYYYNIYATIGPYFDDLGITINDLCAEHIQDFYDEQLLRIKPASVRKYHANIHKALLFAAKKKDKPYYKPFFMMEVDKPEVGKYEAKFLNEDSMLELVRGVRDDVLYLPILLGGFYGLRRGEVYGLRYSCIDFKANTILINHTVLNTKRKGGKKELLFQTPKSDASIRTLPLVPLFKDIFLERKKEQERYRKLFGRSYDTKYQDYVFINPMGGLMNPDQATRRFPKLTECLGFGHMRFHDLRHSCASIMVAKGVPMKQIQEWLGHSDYNLTANTYSHLEFKNKIQTSEAITWINELTDDNKEKSVASKNSLDNPVVRGMKNGFPNDLAIPNSLAGLDRC